MAAHQYWRVLFTAGGAGNCVWVDEVSFWLTATAEAAATGGIALSGGDLSAATNHMTQAFDRLTTTLGWTSPVGVFPAWIGYRFNTVVDLASVKLTLPNTAGSTDKLPQNGSTFVQYSDDGLTWTTDAGQSISGTFAISGVVTITLSAVTDKWWTTAPGLTPVAVFDARYYNPTTFRFLDMVGTNHIRATAVVPEVEGKYRGWAGNGGLWLFGGAVTLPNTGVLMMMVTIKSATILLGKDNTGAQYMFHWYENRTWYTAGVGGASHYEGLTDVGKTQVLAVVRDGVNSTMYVDGVNIGSVPIGVTPASISVMGYNPTDADYNLNANDAVHALGVWSGTATTQQLTDMGEALKAKLRIPMTATILASGSRRGFEPTLDLVNRGKFKAHLPIVYDWFFGGRGSITGTVKKKGSNVNTPISRQVYLFEERTQLLVRSTWSDPLTGVYRFTNLDPTKLFTALSPDYTGEFRALAFSGIAPVIT